MKRPPVVALLTDFGLRDAYVGVMKGVILSICPDARIVDLTHEIPPQDVAAASRTLAANAPYFPEGTVFAAVVDPGVGTDRAALAVRAEGRTYLAPDNGLLGHLRGAQAFRLENPKFRLKTVSATFHGRDVFAPAAAHLARGLALQRLGSRIRRLQTLDLPAPRRTPSGTRGEVVSVDRFGNLITNIPADAAAKDAVVSLGRRRLGPVVSTYASVEPGETAVVVGSSGTLEIAVRNGDARRATRAGVGTPVLVTGDHA